MNLIEAGLKFGHALRNDYLARGNDVLSEKYTKELLGEEMSERLWELFNSKVATRSFYGFSDALILLSTASFDEQRPISQYWVDLRLVVNDKPVLQELAQKHFKEGELVERLIILMDYIQLRPIASLTNLQQPSNEQALLAVLHIYSRIHP